MYLLLETAYLKHFVPFAQFIYNIHNIFEPSECNLPTLWPFTIDTSVFIS